MARGTPEATASALDVSRFRALAETTPDAIVMGDPSGRIAYVNPAAERLFGHRAGQMVGASITIIVPDRLQGAHDAGYRRFVETGRGRIVGTTFEVVGRRADGREFPMELSLGAAGAGADASVTARRRAPLFP